MSGIKYDAGKPAISLIPSEAVEETAIALTYGANKYGRHNYKKGMKHSRLYDAAMRHLLAYNKGEDIDAESGNSHLAHAAASIAMLIYMTKNRPDLDDRVDNEN